MTRTIKLLELEFSRDRNADENPTRDEDGVEKVNTQLKPQEEVLRVYRVEETTSRLGNKVEEFDQ